MSVKELHLDSETLSNSVWVSDCMDCAFRQVCGPETTAYEEGRAHIHLWIERQEPRHRVLIYQAFMLFKPEEK
jgi:hypothetical protein